MIALGNLLIALAGVLHWVINAYNWILIARVILSWVSPDPRNLIVQFIYSATEPLLEKVRRKVPPIGMLDMSVIVVFIVLFFVDSFLVRTLADYGLQMRGPVPLSGM
jgi:YggT family protein